MKSFSSQHALSSPTSSAGESRRNSGSLLQELLPKTPANDASPVAHGELASTLGSAAGCT